MKKSIAIILVICLFACKNNAKKNEALDFCMEQSDNIISSQNNKLLRQFELDTINPFSSNRLPKQYFKMASMAFNLHDEFVRKIDKMEYTKMISLSNLKIEFNKYMDTLLAISSDFDYFKSEIAFEKCRKMKINDTKTCSLVSTILLNEFLQELSKRIIRDEFIIGKYEMRIIPTRDNYKIGDNLQVLFYEDNYQRKLSWNFTQFTRNGIPLNIKDLNYDKDRRMINFKIKEKGKYKIKGYEVVSMSSDYESITDTVPFETEYEVK